MHSKRVVFRAGVLALAAASGFLGLGGGVKLRAGEPAAPPALLQNVPWQDCGGTIAEEQALTQLGEGMLRRESVFIGKRWEESGPLQGLEFLNRLAVNPQTGKWIVPYALALEVEYDPEGRFARAIPAGLMQYWGEWFEFLLAGGAEEAALIIRFNSDRPEVLMHAHRNVWPHEISVNAGYEFFQSFRENPDLIAFVAAHEFEHMFGVYHYFSAKVERRIQQCFGIGNFFPLDDEAMKAYIRSQTIMITLPCRSDAEALEACAPALEGIGFVDRLLLESLLAAYREQERPLAG